MSLFKNPCMGLMCLSFLLSLALSNGFTHDLECQEPSQCQCHRLDNRKRIIGGEKAEVHEFPFQVHIATIFYTNDGLSISGCGGTLISDQWVLTAAHCVLNSELSVVRTLFVVSVGEHIRGTKADTDMTEVLYANKFFSHDWYNARKLSNDIALIKLKEPVKFTEGISPACLPLKDDLKYKDFKGQKATAVGWGRNHTSNKDTSDTLKKLDMRVYSAQNCVYPNSRWRSWEVSEDMVCGYRRRQNVCEGDSGGGLIYEDNGHRYVIGVASFVKDKKCVTYGYPGVFTRVGSFVDWIEEVTGEKFCTG